MSAFRLQGDWFRRRFSTAALTAALALLVGVTLVVIPTIRSTEANESGAAKERGEEPSLTGRLDHARHLRLEFCGLATMRACPKPQSLGHAQRPVLEPPSGHRLSNGLLAPLTC